jgi:phage terminase large subunit-like protein
MATTTQKEKQKNNQRSSSILVRHDLPWLANKDGVEVCYLYENDWQHAVSSGWAVYFFDPKEAGKWTGFFPRYLRHMKGSWKGKPVTLEDWQAEFISRFFGWKKIKNNKRRYRTLFLFIPRKNGKSLIVAGIGLGMLLIDNEGGPEVYVGASGEKQARGLFNVSKYMVRANKDLSLLCQPLKDSIYCEHNEGTYQVITGEADTQEGSNPHAFLADEIHVMKDNSLLQAMITGMGAREQPGLFMMTTAGASRINNPAYQQYDYAKKVRDGVIIDPEYLPVIYEAPAGARIDDMEAIKAANPNFGVTVFEDFFKGLIKKAMHVPALQNSFRRHHMNVFVDADDRWIEYSKWLLCKKSFDFESLRGRRCFAGLDLASRDDLSALVLLFPPLVEGEKYIVVSWFWCPELGIEARAETANVDYRRWSESEKLRFIPTQGEIIDFSYIEKEILKISKMFQLEELAYDPYQATYLATNLEKEGVTCVAVRQGILSMSEPVKNLIALVLSKQLQHDDEVLDWMSNNACLTVDAHENVKFDKKKSTEKIDGMVALAMAVDRAMVNRDDEGDPFENGFMAA